MRIFKKNIIIIIEAFIIVGLIIVGVLYVSKTSEIVNSDDFSKGREIERKWLISVDDIPYNLNENKRVEKIEQTYISFLPEVRIRKCNEGEYYCFTMKNVAAFDGIIRDELNCHISEEAYNNLLKKQEGNTIYKTRYSIGENGYLLEFDIFESDLEGLAYLEIEFGSLDEAQKYQEPSWVVKEVTNDSSYKNGSLAQFGLPDSFYKYMEEYNKK